MQYTSTRIKGPVLELAIKVKRLIAENIHM
ncbi:hypothetical protein JMJ77_0008350 [Colletotrichum scovillei]|uniref:Uncharacterized protein n=1 Tax=Colletotrichum scovillei TaxID=1209932 RepID=A0A9P7UGU2_9PEZI|nr:hypothetical protein JMJ77_0008350 [Colletotrichum scovillei]KAG7075375.1 hypothetical protein JMJ76_0011835 [Colletotrichum scovillei]KAG7082588.1 hypothetical protein JMJ78_0004689 [Colletotrichum scovillei]